VRLVPLSGLDYPYVTYYLPSAPTNEIYWGSTNLGFKLVYPDGSQDVFSLIVYATSNYQASTARAFLTQRIDPQGRATRVGYEYVIFTNSYYSPPAYERAYRVHYVVDPDGRTNTFQYTFDLPFRPYDAWQFSEIDDPYGRKARFTYGYSLPLISTNNAPGLLSSIIDAVGMTNAFKYQPNGTWSPAGPNINGTRSSGWITNLSTPYGNTSFSYYEVPDDTVTDGFWQRAIAVSEPEGAQQLYFYVHTNWTMADTEPSPSNIPGQTDFDDGTSGAAHYSINFRNSFHWGRRQFPALSQAVRNYISVGQLNNALNSLTTNDYNLAHLKHWLLSSIDTNSITESLSSERDPSPDAAGQIPGLRTWYNYPGKTARNLLGSNPQVSCVARSLPDGSSQYITYNYNSPSSFGSFVSDNESSYSRPDGTIGVLTYWFHYAANYVDLASVSNSAGQWWNLGYNTNHQITAITNALNQVTALSWNPNLTGIQFPNGQSIGLSYYTQSSPPTSTSALIKQITIQPEGRVFNINNYTAGNPSSITDDRGLTVANIWDGLNRLTGTIYPDTTYTSNRYDRLDLGAARDRLGSWTYYVHDGLQHLTTVTNANNAVTIYSWCGCGSLNQIFDALNGTTNPTTLNYDNQGNLTNVLYPDATSLMYQFDLAGRMTSAADGAGRAVQIAYNNQGLATIVSGAYGSLASIVYDALNRPISVTDANGITVTNQYDAINELLKRTWPDGTSESYGYSAAGLMAYTNRDQKVTRFGRDAAGRLTAVTNANLEVVQAGYDSLDNIISLVDGLQHTTTWQYNQYGWLTNKVDGLNRNVFRFAYNANGWVTNRWTPEKGNTAYKFDAVGNLTNIFYVGQASSLSYSYDALNHLRTMLDAIGTTAFSYTPAGQLAGEDGPWANDTVTNTYVQGLRTAMSLHSQPSTLNFSYGYDSAWRMTNVISPAGTFGYNYGAPNSASALVTGISLPNAASITNGYDALARLTQTALNNKWGHTLDSYAYIPDALGLRTNIVRNLGLTTSSVTVGYDNIGQLTSWAAAESGGTPRLNEQLGFGYDAAHNLHSRTSGALSQTFNTDAANELTNVTRTGTFTVSGATPAPATSVTVNGQAAQTYGDFTFARTNLTLADGQNIFTNIAQNGYGVCRTNTLTVNLPTNVNLSSDNNGSLTNDGTRAFAYDSENQLTNVSVAEQWKSEFIYDGLGRRRVAKDYAWQGGQWVKTNEVRYVYDGMLAIQERDTNNNPLVTYTRGLDLCGTRQRAGGIGGLLARTDINGSTFYHADAHGNITALMDGNENIVARYLYNPYGKLVGEWGGMAEANKYRFSSKEWDPLSGMYYYGFRFYDPNLQRWPNQDPIGERGGINLYRYVGNNPVNKIDPLGHFGVEADSSSGGVNGVPNIMVNFTPDGHTTISNNDSPEALRIAILFGTGFTAGGLTIIGGIEAPGLTTKVLLALLGVSQHKPDPCPPKDNTKYHYTSSPESDFEKGLRRETHVTDDPNLTSKEAVDKLGVTRPPDKVIPIQDKGDFVPSKPPTVDPNPAKGIGGGGTDYYNPSEVPPDQIGPAIPIDEE
jgi:RHS repeat-associated protein